ncbi:Hypothetical predicted protein [Paramuricea clavata]|uniref:Uncharacterized protein n=1 Tax=Paramuricea clavata TaxID=317549 RepID=A0A6S7JZR3_PARCT|nr:Hypothetical predicted protein [Paramuricea clavata]
MADNWEDVAEYLLRNRRIREMVDDVLNSLDEIGPDCRFTTGEEERTGKRIKPVASYRQKLVSKSAKERSCTS